jgi:hypothetical protein
MITLSKAFDKSVYTPSTWIPLFNFAYDKIGEFHQIGDSRTGFHEPVLCVREIQALITDVTLLKTIFSNILGIVDIIASCLKIKLL